MVQLASRSFLHLMAEVAGPTFDYPFYTQELRVNDDIVTFRSLDDGDSVIPRSIALRHVVPARAVHAAGELSLLLRPVAMEVEGYIHYGQVTTFVHQLWLYCFNMPNDLEEIQTTIMNRVLERISYTIPNFIEAVMEGVMDEDSFPAAPTICRWINPSSGHSTNFHSSTPWTTPILSMEDALRDGRSFCEPPPRQRQDEDDRATDEALEQFVDDDGDMTEPVPRHDHAGTSNQNRSQQAKWLRDNALSPSDEFQHQPSQQRGRVTYQSALDKDASIVEMLRDDPDLFDRFLTIRQQRDSTSHHTLETKRGRKTGLVAEPAPPRIPDQTSKYVFAPRQEQKYIHDQVTAAKYKGKSPNVFVCGLIRSSAVEFKALLGVCTRLYDIRFGSKGLSIGHFARISQDEQVARILPTAEFTKAPPATCLDDVIDAERVFLVFAREYCCDQFIVLTEDIIKFLDGTQKRVVWTPSELPYVVFWVNDVLEEFRDVVEARSDLYHSQQSAKPRFGRIPKHVLRQLPVQIDPATGENIQLLMRHLSNDGCPEDSSDCSSDGGHFVPKKAPEIVKNEIIKRFGGLKQEQQHL
ncbi:hypothetical protein PHMEG_0004444 [Phytophthora megakarya]|uniref:Uncharacterized protein n=1 Tax=Phytophthora megakarya TaxID=4795 RepID=A0A225WVH3_9STRA|nr:hypothetical protein PHMEG_0004444 [Phytophthora megakarya]